MSTRRPETRNSASSAPRSLAHCTCPAVAGGSHTPPVMRPVSSLVRCSQDVGEEGLTAPLGGVRCLAARASHAGTSIAQVSRTPIWRWLSGKHGHLYGSDNGGFSAPRESASDGLSGSSESEMAYLKPADLWQSHNFLRRNMFVRQPRRGAGATPAGAGDLLWSERINSVLGLSGSPWFGWPVRVLGAQTNSCACRQSSNRAPGARRKRRAQTDLGFRAGAPCRREYWHLQQPKAGNSTSDHLRPFDEDTRSAGGGARSSGSQPCTRVVVGLAVPPKTRGVRLFKSATQRHAVVRRSKASNPRLRGISPAHLTGRPQVVPR